MCRLIQTTPVSNETLINTICYMRVAYLYIYPNNSRDVYFYIYPNNSRDVYLYIYWVSAYMG